MDERTLTDVKRTLHKVSRENGMAYTAPLGVWGNPPGVIGVIMRCPKNMGGVECVAEASFTLSDKECIDEAAIRAKVELAAKSVKSEILVTIRPKPVSKVIEGELVNG